MKRAYQTRPDGPIEELTEQLLKAWTKSKELNMATDGYREIRRQMAEAQARNEQDKFVAEVTQRQDYQNWLADGLKKDEHRRKKRIPTEDAKRVALYISSMKSGLPAVIPTATFTESTDRWGRTGLWRVQDHARLTGLCVLDADHVPDARAMAEAWLKREDFKELGIVWIFITPSAEGVKVVFKARTEWGNLADNYYTLAEKLGVLDHADSQCKNADHCHYLPKYTDILYIDWQELFGYENPAFEQRYGEAYRRGESAPTQPRWMELERSRKAARTAPAQKTASPAMPHAADEPPTELDKRELAIVKALNAHYGESLPTGRRHETFIGETAPWLLLLTDNKPQQALLMARRLDYVRNWTDQTAGELENCVSTVQAKPLLTRRPRRLQELLAKAGIDTDGAQPATGTAEEELPFDEWIERIRSLFDEVPCLREVCEPHPERLWPFLLFAAAGLLGTDMTLTWYYFYDQPEQKRRLNYNVLGVGDPASGKGALVRIASLLTEPLAQADQLANDAINTWKEELRSKGANKDKRSKPKGVVRLHGARTSNNVFITDMMNAVAEVEGETMHQHMLTVDTEALNSIKMQKGGSWIDRQVMEIKAWSNEKDSQQYSNLDSVTGFFNVYWNLVRTCTPPALKVMVNERNFGTGYPTRLSVIPILGTGFQMMPLRRQSPKALEADEVLRQWAYKLDKRQGELPLWPLVEYSWHWTNDHMEIAAFNDDRADELLLKRVAMTSLCIAAPWVDMRHWEEREKTGTYETDDTDKALLDLVLDIQYRTQHFWFGELARNYFDEQMKDATHFRRRTTRYGQCFEQLPAEFTTEQFTQVFGFANPHSSNKAIQRLITDKAIERTKRGEYRKRVQSIG